jgi:SAM-dependent methyltransferase
LTGGAGDSVVERYNARANDYTRWWAPVLEGAARRLIDYVEWYTGGPPPAGAAVLEVGTGSGNLARAVLEHWPTANVTASDVAGGMLDVARERLADVDPSRVRFVEAPAAKLPVGEGTVDLIVSSFVLQLVPDRLAALREARRLLRPGGVVAYVTWIDREGNDFEPALEFDEAVLDLKVDEPADGGGRYAGDVASQTAAASQLRRAGFRNVVAREDELEYDWTRDTYLDYKLAYDETALMAALSGRQRQALERRARERLSRLPPAAFHWRPPIVYAAGRKLP